MKPSPPVLAAFGVALAARLVLIQQYPVNLGLDGFQRWAGRDYWLVQGWLPATQMVVWAVAELGGSFLAARVAMAVVASLAIGAGAMVAEAVAGRVGAWLFLGAATFGPFLLWGTALYQEGTFLLFLFGGLALALRGHPRLGDLVIGAVGLVRYEGWPLVALYALWRRDPRALTAGWGIALWMFGRGVLGWTGHHASPVNYFSDWDGIVERFSLATWAGEVGWLAERAFGVGAFTIGGLGAAGAWIGRRRPEVLLVAIMALAQVALVLVWIAGLEQATYRMLVIPALLAAVPASVAVTWIHAKLPREWMRAGLVTGLVVLMGVGLVDASRVVRGEVRWTRPERAALDEMAGCPECRWYVVPRTEIGPRDRHDGCELLQGVSALRHGEDFFCDAWPAGEGREADVEGLVEWVDGGYRVSVRPPLVLPDPPAPTPEDEEDGPDVVASPSVPPAGGPVSARPVGAAVVTPPPGVSAGAGVAPAPAVSGLTPASSPPSGPGSPSAAPGPASP